MLRYEDCLIRALTSDDLPLVLNWRNSDAIRKNMYTDKLITPEEHRAWFEAGQKNEDRRHLLFSYKSEPLGAVNITGIDTMNSRCNWGFYIGKSDSPPGAGLAMGYLAIEYMFNTLKVHKICSEAFVFNTASLGYHKKLGFVEEGCLKEHVRKNGRFEDIICFALFREKWDEHKSSVRIMSFGGMD